MPRALAIAPFGALIPAFARLPTPWTPDGVGTLYGLAAAAATLVMGLVHSRSYAAWHAGDPRRIERNDVLTAVWFLGAGFAVVGWQSDGHLRFLAASAVWFCILQPLQRARLRRVGEYRANDALFLLGLYLLGLALLALWAMGRLQ